jgi:hypothetical protein
LYSKYTRALTFQNLCQEKERDCFCCAICCFPKRDGNCKCCFVEDEKQDLCCYYEGGILRECVSRYYTPVIGNNIFKAVVIVIFLGFFGFGLAVTPKLSENFSLRFFVPSDHPLQKTFDIADKEYNNKNGISIDVMLDHRFQNEKVPSDLPPLLPAPTRPAPPLPPHPHIFLPSSSTPRDLRGRCAGLGGVGVLYMELKKSGGSTGRLDNGNNHVYSTTLQ